VKIDWMLSEIQFGDQLLDHGLEIVASHSSTLPRTGAGLPTTSVRNLSLFNFGYDSKRTTQTHTTAVV
jgi:hypothetical protein